MSAFPRLFETWGTHFRADRCRQHVSRLGPGMKKLVPVIFETRHTQHDTAYTTSGLRFCFRVSECFGDGGGVEQPIQSGTADAEHSCSAELVAVYASEDAVNMAQDGPVKVRVVVKRGVARCRGGGRDG